MKIIRKYIGTYRVFAPLDYNTGKTTSNEWDNYILGKYHIECYRYDKNTLSVYFPSGRSSTNIVLPQFDKLNIKYKLHIDGDYESIYLISEKDLTKIHSILKFQTKGKDIKPDSIRTARRQK